MRKYIIGTGWYCEPNREFRFGSPITRTIEFHQLWKTLLFRYTSPAAVIVVDSASPIPLPADDREQQIRLDENYQGREREGIIHDGWMRSFLHSASFAWNCQADLIYVEQDCLVVGQGWVDKIYETAASFNFTTFLAGATRWRRRKCHGRWHLQQSLVFVPREIIPEVVYRISTASQVAAERQMSECGVSFKSLPFGYGRIRPLPIDDESVFYAQHLTDAELTEILSREELSVEFPGLTTPTSPAA